jgi:hypothetical protein
MLTREQLALAQKYGGSRIQARTKFSLQVSSQGKRSTGKTAFPLRTAPGPIMHLDLDEGSEDVNDQIIKQLGREDIITIPVRMPTFNAKNDDAVKELQGFATESWAKISLSMSEAVTCGFRSILLDTGDETWRILRMGLFGKLAGVKQMDYDVPNLMMTKLLRTPQEHGVNCFCTHKVSETWVTEKYKNDRGEEKERRVPSGIFVREGFKDTDYIFRVDVEHMNRPGPGGIGLEFGLRVLRCTANPNITGVELWGDDCTVPMLGQMVYEASTEDDWR